MIRYLKTAIETGIDILDLIILVSAIAWPALIVAKIALRTSPALYSFIQYRRVGNRQLISAGGSQGTGNSHVDSAATRKEVEHVQ